MAVCRFFQRLLSALFLWVACSSGGYAQGTIRPEEKRMQLGVRGISKSEQDAISGIYSVSPSREINLPRIGSVKVSGWGYAALSLEIQKAYRASGLYPDIEVDGWFFDGCCIGAAQCIDISGDLWVPQLSIPIRFGKMKLSEALADMRPKDSADLAKIEIVRDGKQIVVDATTKEGLETALKNHDLVNVPTKNQKKTDGAQTR